MNCIYYVEYMHIERRTRHTCGGFALQERFWTSADAGGRACALRISHGEREEKKKEERKEKGIPRAEYVYAPLWVGQCTANVAMPYCTYLLSACLSVTSVGRSGADILLLCLDFSKISAIPFHHIRSHPHMHPPSPPSTPIPSLMGRSTFFAHHYPIRVHSKHILCHVFEGEVHLVIGKTKGLIE